MGIREITPAHLLVGAFLVVFVADAPGQRTELQAADKTDVRFCLRSSEEQGKQVCFVDQSANQSSVEPGAFAEHQHRLRVELERRAAEARAKQPKH